MIARILLTGLLFATTFCIAGAEETDKPDEPVIKKTEVGQTPNVSVYKDQVWFGGQPQADDIKSFADLGVKTVINLRTAPEMESLGFDEKALVEEAGMKYIHIPMGREEPTDEFIADTLKQLGMAGDEKFLLHCGSSNRVGYVWSLFAAKKHGLGEEEAIAEGKAAGMRAPQLEEWARKELSEAKER